MNMGTPYNLKPTGRLNVEIQTQLLNPTNCSRCCSMLESDSYSLTIATSAI